jgi:ATP-binding protein involved in chromosome partitioning
VIQLLFVLVASGKGGTGKTIFTLNLAKELSRRGVKVGVLDGDIDDSNTLQMLGIKDAQVGLTEDKRFVPIVFDGIELFAMPGISGNKPISMDGSEYSEIVHDVVEQTAWTSDYCVVDAPAGAADPLRTMVLGFSDRLLGAIVVMQPAHADSARRAIEFFQMEGIPVLGVVENMSGFRCGHGEEYPIFGASKLEDVAKEYGVEPLGRIPLSMEVKEAVERGQPFLSGDAAKPVERAADVVLAAKPMEPGLVERLKQRARGFARAALMDLMAGLVGVINTEVPIREYQAKYAFPGGKTIELDVCDRSMRRVNAQMFFRIEDGVLKVVKNPKHIDTEVRIWDSAFIWSVLGWRPVGGRQAPFDFMDAWLLGEIKYFGVAGDTQRAISFFRDVWRDLSQRVRSNKRLMGMLERLA